MLLHWLVAICSCLPVVRPSRASFKALATKGLSLTKRVEFGSAPEAKLQTAQDLLSHASKYDQLISRSTELSYSAKAHGLQRQEREAAALLMREAAADYAKRKDVTKAREIYQFLFTTFPEDEYRSIRRGAESSLKQLNEIEKETN
jgi:hypothetical protein